jgi:cytidyltransferase-like protein
VSEYENSRVGDWHSLNAIANAGGTLGRGEGSEPCVNNGFLVICLILGHIEFLKRAKQMGDYLLVGIHDDQTVNAIKGVNYPLMNLHERVLSVLACRVSLPPLNWTIDSRYNASWTQNINICVNSFLST